MAEEAESEPWSPDSTLFVEGYDVADDTEGPLVGIGVPAVVAVVLTHDPGPWLEPMLTSLNSQEYANLSTLVVDAASLIDPTERVAAIMPTAFVKRIDEVSFASAANAALGTIEGASFLLFCHDDVEFGPGAVQAMVEEAFRSNAGIVGAKLVDWDDTERIRTVGGSIDKFGFAWPIAEPNELDQSQHDAVREAFVVSSAAMLVRSDLFGDLGGFSTDIDGSGEDLDLCWRARVAGARTVVMPAAVVRHRERAGIGDPSGRSYSMVLAHQARVMLVCYTPIHLVRIAPQALILAFADLLVALVRGRLKVASAIVSAIGWNISHLPTTLRLRGQVKRSRRTPDHEIRRLQIKGSARITSFVRQQTAGNRSVTAALAAAARGLPGARGTDPSDGYWTVAVTIVATLFLLIGSRGLITGGVPAIREFVPLGQPTELVREWWSGWRTPGLGAAGGTPTLNLVAGVLGWITFGSAGLVRTVLILSPLPLGAISVWRLLRGCASSPARAAGLLTYLVNPLPYNAIAEGRWQALVVYAATPAILGRIARAGAWAPFDGAQPAPGSVQRQTVGMGVVIAAATAIAPVTSIVAVLLCAVVLAVMAVLNREGRPLKALAVTGGGLVLSALIHLPWTLSVLTSSNRWEILTGASASRRSPVSLSEALHFDTGPHGGVLTAGLLIAAVIALLIAVDKRFHWVVVAVVLIIVSLVGIVVARRLYPDIGFVDPEVMLSLAAVGVALAAALGVDAFRSDVVGGAFGWRQLLSVVAVVAVGVSSLPLALDFLDGRWMALASDADASLAQIQADQPNNERTLWIGDSDALASQGWPLGDGMKFALTSGVRPTLSSMFPPGMGDGEQALRSVLRDAQDGQVSRLGTRLAPFGVRYVVVVRRLAPLPYGKEIQPIDAQLEARLGEQFDLGRLDVAPGLQVYENRSWLPVRSITTDEEVGSMQSADAANRLIGAPFDAGRWTTNDRWPTRFTGKIAPNSGSGAASTKPSLVTLMTRDANWSVSTGGEAIVADAVFGWAAIYPVKATKEATLRYSTPLSSIALHLLQLLVVCSLPWIRRRRVHESRFRRSHSVDPDHPSLRPSTRRVASSIEPGADS